MMNFERNVLASLLVVLAVYFQPANCLECIKCNYDSTSSEKVCNNSVVDNCSSSYSNCFAQVHTMQNKTYYSRGCATNLTCASPSAYCTTQKSTAKYKACERTCCQTNKCNKEFPSLSGGVDHTKVGQAAFALGLVAAILFA